MPSSTSTTTLLKEQEEDSLDLELKSLTEDTTEFLSLAQTILEHPPLRRFRLDGFRSAWEPNWEDSLTVELLFRALARHPLESIELENLGLFLPPFPLSRLTRLLHDNHSTLKRLELRDIVLQGHDQDWKEYQDALAGGGLPPLEAWVLETVHCWVAGQPRRLFEDWNSTLYRLAWSSPKLRELVLILPQGEGYPLQVATLERLGALESLQQLTLSNSGLVGSYPLTLFFQKLCAGDFSKLQSLTLQPCQMDASSTRAICQFLVQPNTTTTTLQTIHITVEKDSPKLDDALLLEILSSLRHNHSLEYFQIHNLEHDEASSSTSSSTRSRVTEAYQELIQWNASLLDMHVFEQCTTLVPEDTIEFYQELNHRYGRKRFLWQDENGCRRNEWVELLSRVSDCVGYLFYFLRLNPTLCGH